MTDVTNQEFADAWDCIVANHGGIMTDVNQHIDVTEHPPQPVTILQSALDALAITAAREIHRMGELEPQQAAAVLNRISWLEARHRRQSLVIINLAERLAELEPANPYEEVE